MERKTKPIGEIMEKRNQRKKENGKEKSRKEKWKVK